jgi:hypothetical protein
MVSRVVSGSAEEGLFREQGLLFENGILRVFDVNKFLGYFQYM